jgi:phytanoyl-CoA hydroxylase
MKTNDYNFEDHGFVIIKNVFDETTLSEIRNLTQRVIEYGNMGFIDPFANYYLKHRTDQGVLYDIFQRHHEFQKLAKNDRILNEIQTQVGQDVFLYENSLVYKPKNKNNAVPWHQDFINRPNEPIKYIAWMALDNVKISNGAMKVIPGSHKFGFLPWHTIPGETHHTRVNTDGINLEEYVYVELNAGDVLIFNQLLLHSSDKIDSEDPRRAYRVSYQGFEQIFTPRGTPIVLAGGSPESLAQKYNQDYASSEIIFHKKNIIKRGLNFIGRKLSSI